MREKILITKELKLKAWEEGHGDGSGQADGNGDGKGDGYGYGYGYSYEYGNRIANGHGDKDGEV